MKKPTQLPEVYIQGLIRACVYAEKNGGLQMVDTKHKTWLNGKWKPCTWLKAATNEPINFN